jgi:hypothetical protein
MVQGRTNLRAWAAARHHKNETDFSDVIAPVRRQFWVAPNSSMFRRCPARLEMRKVELRVIRG